MTSYLKRVRCIGKVLLLTVLLASCKSSSKQLQDIFKDAAGNVTAENVETGFLDEVVTAVHENQKLIPLFEDGSYESCLPTGYAELEMLPDLTRIVPIAASWERGEDGCYRYPISCDDSAWSTLKSGEPEYVMTIPKYVVEDVTDEELMLLLMSCPEQFAWSETSSVSPAAYVELEAETSAAWKRVYEADAILTYAEKQGLTYETAQTYAFPGCEGRALANIQKNFSAYLRDIGK